ncbi:DUF4270 domain-containing protein [Lutibacter sp. A80]|uniref:DUF4270 domain-containing protein n=1 Tax=Lutibacter sp. A80 TaxID=2918453 RepID=UPI001F05A6AD|nr:DUF4270 domain-containing protein [Lutibacter sp. A80]UMB59450.1 DUF4270 domain-containing protein [Lutibacter sp. A80]
MTTKVVSTFKYLGILSLVFFSLTSCEKEIDSIGVDLIDNGTFDTNKLTSEVITTNENIDRIPSNLLSQYLLGVYADEEFGKLKASIVTQLTLPTYGTTYASGYGDDVAIDSVLINIPYQATRTDNYSDGRPQFTLDSVFGNEEIPFKLDIFELKTFLNSLDPEDPSKQAIYYSDKEFQKADIPLFSGDFKVNPSDTVTYIKRYLNDGVTVYDTDTIKNDDLSPSINLPLDKTLIHQLFVENASGSEFLDSDSFNHYFRGLYIEASELLSEKSHLLSLNMSAAKMVIYYSKTQDETDEQDLNENGTKGEDGVRTKHTYNFTFGSLKSNILERDYTNSKLSGDDRIYVQGAAGSLATVDLFTNENLTELRANNWLITDATLTFYVDQNASSNIAPEQLLIYNYDENTHILDMITEGAAAVDGTLERDDDGNPYKYEFKITDYISEILNSDDDEALDLAKLGIKVYNSSDLLTSITDLTIKDYSWTPKGVVLYNHNESAGDKKAKLEITYTEINN